MIARWPGGGSPAGARLVSATSAAQITTVDAGTAARAAAFLSASNARWLGMTEDLARRARRHGLTYVDADLLPHHAPQERPGLRLSRCNAAASSAIRATLARIRALVIPPAWTEVRIAGSSTSAYPGDRQGRRGPPAIPLSRDWTVVRDKVKAERLLRFGRALPKIRARIEKDLGAAQDRPPLRRGSRRPADRPGALRSGHTGSEEGGRGRHHAAQSRRPIERHQGDT